MWIIVEGLDGSGKSTAIEILKKELESRGKTVVLTKGIGSGNIGSFLREEIVEKENLTPDMELFAFPLAILDCCRQIKAHLDLGHVVITDRFIDSYWAYSPFANSLIEGVCEFLWEKVNNDIRQPAHVLYIDAPIHTCLERISKRGGERYFDKASREDFLKVKYKYVGILYGSDCYRIPNIGSLGDLEKEISKVLNIKFI